MISRSKIGARSLAKAAFLVALSIVMTRFVYIMVPIAGANALRISFGELPLMMSGFLFGPIVGGLAGLASDLIGFAINPQGAYHPGFTLSSIMWGVIPGLYMLLAKRRVASIKSLKLYDVAIPVILAYIIISLGLNTYWLSQLFGIGFLVLLPFRIIAAAISIPIYTLALNYLIKLLVSIRAV